MVSLTQGSGVPQPWAMIWNPVGILNTYVGILIPYPEWEDVGNDKNLILKRAPDAHRPSILLETAPIDMLYNE